jgi:purine/pyrimidine-nucleoside phosphorylase
LQPRVHFFRPVLYFAAALRTTFILADSAPPVKIKVNDMLKHNTYFNGNVQSVGFERNGMRATAGVIAPGEYHFNTDAPERMTVVSGELRAKLAGGEWMNYSAGTYFEVPANSGFDVTPVGGPAAYLCEFLG